MPASTGSTFTGADGVLREVRTNAELVGLTPFTMAVMDGDEAMIDLFLAAMDQARMDRSDIYDASDVAVTSKVLL